VEGHLIETKAVKKLGKPKGIQRFPTNPFINKMTMKTPKTRIRYAELGQQEGVTVKIGDKVVSNRLYTLVEHEVSGEQFVKLYSRYATLWFDLSLPAQKLFNVFFKMVLETPPLITYFYLHSSDPVLLQYIKTPKTFHRAVNELIENQIIARHFSEGWYWLNPFVMGKGDQVKIIANLKIKDSQKKSQSLQQGTDQ
jgi:hypothetical protein